MIKNDSINQVYRFGELVKLDIFDGIAVVALIASNNNILTQAYRKEIRRCFEYIKERSDVRAIVLTGGENFCAGADIKEFEARSASNVSKSHCRNGHSMMLTIASMKVPVIAAIEGFCLGGGFELALACDFRVVAANARLGLPEIERGVFPGTGGLYLLRRLIGTSNAKRIALNGVLYSADDRDINGLVDKICPPLKTRDHAIQMAKVLAAKPAGSVERIIKLIDSCDLEDFKEYLRLEEELYISVFQLNDAREGASSFLNKRKPIWSHS